MSFWSSWIKVFGLYCWNDPCCSFILREKSNTWLELHRRIHDRWLYVIVFQRLQNGIHSTELSFREYPFRKGHWHLHLSADKIERAVISFILIQCVTGIRPPLPLTYIATLLAYPWNFGCPLRLLNCSNYIMNIGVILHIMKAVIASHLLHFEGLRG